MTDFRALCAQLLRGLDENRHPEVRYPGDLRIVMARARAALLQQQHHREVERKQERHLMPDDLIRRLMEQLKNFDDADPYHDCADLILEARLFLEREEERAS